MATTFTNIPNATLSTFGRRSATVADAGDYRVLVANVLGDSVTSRVARVEVMVPQFIRATTGPHVSDNADHQGAAWGDFNGDGFVDLAVTGGYWASGTPVQTTVYTNRGDGTFAQAPPPFPATAYGYGINWADADMTASLIWSSPTATKPMAACSSTATMATATAGSMSAS